MVENDTKGSSSAAATPEGGERSGAVGAVNAALAARGSGADQGDASIHDNSTSHAAADALGAKAFTAGQDVFFGAGHYAPGTAGGDRSSSTR